MVYRVKLKNTDKCVTIDQHVYEALYQDPHLKNVEFFPNLRMHSSGCAVFQKTVKSRPRAYKTETIYLHKIIAERFLWDTRTDENNLVVARNGNKLNCRLSNLVYQSRSVASRKRKSSSQVGYTGVYVDNNRYRAVICVKRKSIHLGMYDTAEEAARAYNQMSRELYGEDGKINIIETGKVRDRSDQSVYASGPGGTFGTGKAAGRE